MQNRFTLFIDESGEVGIEKVRTATTGGASPYMTFGAALIKSQSQQAATKALPKIENDIGKKTLHCAQLNHYDILHFAKSVVEHKPRFFGLISLKETLGDYKDDIEEKPNLTTTSVRSTC